MVDLKIGIPASDGQKEVQMSFVSSWLCSLSPAIAAIAAALLAVHGWILGESAPISENSGPFLFEIHLVVMGLLVLLATFLAGPAWLLLCFIPGTRQPLGTLAVHVFVFGAGWLLLFGAMALVEDSPARNAF